jgi:hypothetical protein
MLGLSAAVAATEASATSKVADIRGIETIPAAMLRQQRVKRPFNIFVAPRL